MQAIEFKSQLEHGQIAVPAAFHLMEGQPVRVLILLDETSAVEEAKRYPSENIWEKTAGAWQGGFLPAALRYLSEPSVSPFFASLSATAKFATELNRPLWPVGV